MFVVLLFCWALVEALRREVTTLRCKTELWKSDCLEKMEDNQNLRKSLENSEGQLAVASGALVCWRDWWDRVWSRSSWKDLYNAIQKTSKFYNKHKTKSAKLQAFTTKDLDAIKKHGRRWPPADDSGWGCGQ